MAVSPSPSTAQLKAIKGDVTNPGISFVGATGSGLYGVSDTEIGVTLSGSQCASFDANGININGDINLDNGPSPYTVNFQVITPTQNRVVSIPDATGTIALIAGVNGQLIYNLNGSQAGWGSSNIDGNGDITLTANIAIGDSKNLTLGEITGTKIGTSTSQKLAFFNATPIVRPTTSVGEVTFVENAGGTAINTDSTFSGYTVQQVVQALINLGLLS